MKYSIVGTGNIALHLATMLSGSGNQLLQVIGRKENEANLIANIGGGNFFTDIKALSLENDLVFIAVSDDAIESISIQIPENIVVVHTSGNTSIELLRQKKRGVVWPLYSFAKDKKIDYDKIPFLLDASDDDLKTFLRDVFEKISNHIYFTTSEERRKVHLAAVFANNFTNHLHHIAETILKEIPLPFDVLLPMIQNQISNPERLSFIDMQTGPARRDDRSSINDHLNLLNNNEELSSIYKAITNSILKTYHGKKL